MIKIRLFQAMANAGIRHQIRLVEKTGITKAQISEIINEKSKGIRFDTLDRLCEALNCNVQDILVHVPNKEAAS